MGSALNNLSFFKKKDFICMHDTDQPMGDDNAGTVIMAGHYRIMNAAFSIGIDGRCCIVQYANGRVKQVTARDRYPLTLSTGKRYPSLAHQRLIIAGQLTNEVVQLRIAPCLYDACII
jgi:hypothetical protein